MIQTLLTVLTHSLGTSHSAPHVLASLPKPKAKITVPIIVILAVLVFIGVTRKLLKLAVLAGVICVLFLIYQSGAFSK